MIDQSALKNALLRLHAFSAAELNAFTDLGVVQKFQRKDLVIGPGQVCQSLNFVLNGSFRFYTQRMDAELTINFFTEHQWMTDVESLLNQQPSRNYLKAMEDSEIFSISLYEVHALISRYPSFLKINALIADMLLPVTHIMSLKLQDPETRYRELLEARPGWVNRFPLMHIASYLGMTAPTLSRVRQRLR